MPRIAVVTDSTSDLPEGLARELGVRIVPLNVHFGDEVFRDQLDIFPEEFYHRLEEAPVVPRTSQPAPGDFLNVYRELISDGVTTIISVHLSGRLSGTIGSAQLASQMLPGADIRVLDSMNVSACLGLLVLDAARMATEGVSADSICAHVQDRAGTLRLLFVLDTLEYLQKNGRIGKASSLLGTLLNIKPILTIAEGMVTPFEKTRGRAKAVKRILEVAKTELGKRAKARAIAVVYSRYPEQAHELRQELLKLNVADEILLSEIGPVVGVHAGPGAVGIAF